MTTGWGSDLHDFESEHTGLDEQLRDDPRAALPELLGLVERMLRQDGYPIGDPVAETTTEDIQAEYESARELVRAIDSGVDDMPGDVGRAVTALEGIFATLVATRPGGSPDLAEDDEGDEGGLDGL
jgi:hypothetical protein